MVILTILKMLNLDPNKIKAKINELNGKPSALNNRPKPLPLPFVPLAKKQEEWEEVQGYFWYTEIMPDQFTGGVKIMPSGLPIKLFINKLTGELKTFPAKLFE